MQELCSTSQLAYEHFSNISNLGTVNSFLKWSRNSPRAQSFPPPPHLSGKKVHRKPVYSQLTLQQVPFPPKFTFIRARNLSKMLTAKTNVSVENPKKLVRLQRSSTLAFLCLGHRVFSFCGKKSKVRTEQQRTVNTPTAILLRLKGNDSLFSSP